MSAEGSVQRESQREVTRLLVAWRGGDKNALEQLFPLVYAELRQRAAAYIARERAGHTLQPTALVHEAFMRLVHDNERPSGGDEAPRGVDWQNRAHFLAVAARVMRLVLIDHARAHRAQKRGGDQRITLDDAVAFSDATDVDVLALEDALKELETLDERQARVVELRFFGGLNVEETAEVLSCSPATVKREWRMAKAWLHNELFDET